MREGGKRKREEAKNDASDSLSFAVYGPGSDHNSSTGCGFSRMYLYGMWYSR